MTRQVMVTGGGTGIGRAVAAAFAAAGDTVTVTGRRSGPLRAVAEELGRLSAAGGLGRPSAAGGLGRPSAAGGRGARAVVCDGADPAQLGAALPHLPERVDVLVHCAGGNTDFDRPAADDLSSLAGSWRANLESNLLTAVLTTAAVRDRLADGGSVITIGSIAADQGAGAYGAAKAAVASWNVDLAADLGPRGVTANVVSPGYIADTEFFRDRLTPQRREALVAATATGRVGVPQDVAGTVLFLASPAARHVTGQVLAVNGGARTTR